MKENILVLIGSVGRWLGDKVFAMCGNACNSMLHGHAASVNKNERENGEIK